MLDRKQATPVAGLTETSSFLELERRRRGTRRQAIGEGFETYTGSSVGARFGGIAEKAKTSSVPLHARHVDQELFQNGFGSTEVN
jgi:hypothetical protein